MPQTIKEFLDKRDDIYFANMFHIYYKEGSRKYEETHDKPKTYEEVRDMHVFACEYVRKVMTKKLEALDDTMSIQTMEAGDASNKRAVASLLMGYYESQI